MTANKNKVNTNEIEEDEQFLKEFNETPPEDVFAYNELRSCADLVRMYNSNIVETQPDYQREIVWKPFDQSRFIDSLMKELPIPSMCFSLDNKTHKWQVIDGLQRMSTIIKFINDKMNEQKWIISKLDDIDPRISGKSVEEIYKKYPELARKLENLALPITILRCDFNKPNHMEYIFTIFQRLNTGGVKLSNQEIRNAIFQGSFNNLLRDCDVADAWLSLTGRTQGHLERFRHMELILRFFAFMDNYKNYKGKLTSFLNGYMRINRNMEKEKIDIKKELFINTTGIINNKIKHDTDVKRLSNVVLDALLFGVGNNLKHLMEVSSDKTQKLFDSFISNEIFSTKYIAEGTLQRTKVLNRLETASKIFSE
jgi:uncharacterized protein with ParB-like and HNH nuclease domain